MANKMTVLFPELKLIADNINSSYLLYRYFWKFLLSEIDYFTGFI